MSSYTILQMFENLRRGRQARNFTTNVPKSLDLKLSSEHIFSKNFRWVPLCYYVCWVGQSLGCYFVDIISRFACLNGRRLFQQFYYYSCWVGQSLGCYFVDIMSRFAIFDVRRFFQQFCYYACWVGQSLGYYFVDIIYVSLPLS